MEQSALLDQTQTVVPAGARPADRWKRKVFLFLQGPISPFFPKLADELEARGHKTLRINVCFGDFLFWRRPGAINYRGLPSRWPGFIREFLRREKVTDLVLLGEQRFYQKEASAAAREFGIDITVTDFGYLRPDWITLESDGMSGLSRFPRDPDVIRALARYAAPPSLAQRYRDNFRNQAVWDVVFHLSNTFCRPFFPFYQSYQLHHPILAYLGTGLRLLLRRERHLKAMALIEDLRRQARPVYVFPMQMENDFQLRAYSPYPDMRTPIRETIRSFAANAPADARLVIKVHPLDPGLRRWDHLIGLDAKAAGVGDRVHYIDGGVLDDLLAISSGVVTINSTVGVWAMRAGCPVITLGTAIFDIPGLTYQGALDDFWTRAVPPDRALFDDFTTALAQTIQIRGVYYEEEGLAAAAQEAADRLDRGILGSLVVPCSPSAPLRQFRASA
jgi:capsular polysaccharide export protein